LARDSQDETQTDTFGSERAAEPTFESISFLNDFLDYCSRQGLLSPFERQILIKFKVDGALSESAVRVRVHRIMQRLQAAALPLGTKTGDSMQRCRPNLARSYRKNSRGHETFFF
jgi:hypothetical protein